MRSKFLFHRLNDGIIGYDYQYRLASLIYRKLGEKYPEISEKEHSREGSKMYTISGLMGTKSEVTAQGLLFETGYFVLSSPDDELILNATESFLDSPGFEIKSGGKVGRFEIEKVEVLKPPKIVEKCAFKTLSPVYVKTIRGVGRDRKEIDLYPNEPKFYERIHQNLVSKYTEFYNKKPEDHFEALGIKNTKTKRVKIDNEYRRCSLFSITLQGDPELLKFAYDAGIGEKTAMGFGCLDIIKKL